jgi:hypothetical protein
MFVGSWKAFLFFESDRLFDPQFVDAVIGLLERENSHVACLINLDKADQAKSAGAATIFFDKSTTGARYVRALQDGGPAAGWLYTVDRYVCCSDVGD